MKKIIQLLFLSYVLILSGCKDSDFLNRPPLQTMNDENYWTSENNVRLFANSFYPQYFVGYNAAWGVNYAPLRGYYFSDDFTSTGTQTGFETQAPEDRASLSETADWMTNYVGPTWNFSWVRKSNLFLERIERMKDSYLNAEAYNHWKAVARFFRGYEYSRLVSVFGNIPYYDHTLSDTNLDDLYKDRDNRTVAMDGVYDDFRFVLDNMRAVDGDAQYLNRYIAASFISRFMLFEGTWQKYHLNNTEKAKKYLEMAVEAAAYVINSGRYAFTSDFRSLFGNINTLSANQEVIMFRHYDAAIGVLHHVASYSNLVESQSPAPNLALAKSFICTDGKPYQVSSLPGATTLDIANLVATRDPRFEATFWHQPRIQSSTLLYACKFIDRTGTAIKAANPGDNTAAYNSNTNTNDAPVMRLAEVVLNWVEAKAELATMGGVAVTQNDLDKSINAIRSRPLDQVAIDKGVKKTAPMMLGAIAEDPGRDSDVSPLLWEIRRERRMEFIYEHSRLLDIKRWKKINYMDAAQNPDILRGPWVNIAQEVPQWLAPAKENIMRVQKADGTIVTYNGSNAAEMVGYYIPDNIQNRAAFTDRVYMAPIGKNQITQYSEKGYTLTQTTGW